LHPQRSNVERSHFERLNDVFYPLFSFFDLYGPIVEIEKGRGMMPVAEENMAKLWILRGAHEAPGWNQLRKAYEDEKIDIIHLDAKVWAIIHAEEEPSGFEGLNAQDPADGMYIDPNGSPLYLAGGEILTSAEALGPEAREALEKTGDAETALERLRKVY
jgi:hypothetical protein